MRRIDHLLGGVMCAVLTIARRLSDPLRRRPPKHPERILLVKLAEQGAWVVAWSAIQDAINMVGRDNVWVMTFKENRFVLDQMDLIPPENVLEVRTSGPVRTSIDLIRAVHTARRVGVDAAIDMEFFARSSTILCFLSGASRRVGFHRSASESSYRGDLHTHRLVFNQRLHIGETFRLLVAALGTNPRELPAFEPTKLTAEAPTPRHIEPAEFDEVRAMVARRCSAVEAPRLVLLNANAGDLLPLRRWPEDRYVELAMRLLASGDDIVVAFTGSPAEAADAKRIADAVGSPRAISLGGATTLRQLLVLYSMSEVLVTNDSGPAHYAALTPIDIVTLFGPETPTVFGSLSPRNHSLWAALPCSPCVNAYNDRITSCTNNLCMQQLSIDQVEQVVVEILRDRLDDPEVIDVS